MKTAVFSLAMLAAAVGNAQVGVVQQVFQVDRAPAPLLSYIPLGSGQYGGIAAPTAPGEKLRYSFGADSFWNTRELMDTTEVFGPAAHSVQPGYWSKQVTQWWTAVVFTAISGFSEMVRVQVAGEVENVVSDQSGAQRVAAFVVKSPTPQLGTFHDYPSNRVPVLRPVPGAVRALNVNVLPSGVSFVSTLRSDGRVDYHNIFSKGGIRWSLTFPAGTIVRPDPSGHSFAATQTANGILVRRFDFNANEEGSVLLPTSLGDRLLGADADPNHYFFLLTSKPNNGRRNAQILRLNPSLQPRTMELIGDLATGKPGLLKCDKYGQVYTMVMTTKNAKNSF